jgi:tRNA G18 (ribose-2'-O)-methylase SpoU
MEEKPQNLNAGSGLNTKSNSAPVKPDFYLLIYNIQKYRNIGMIIRSASAFNVKAIFVYGNKKILKKFFGNQQTTDKNEYVFFDNLDTLKKHCKQNSISICGIEITEHSKPAHTNPFIGHTLFVLGNEGTGLSDKAKQLCDQFVYIQQYSNKTASLNVAIAASIIFNHFAIWADYTPSQINQEKFVLSEQKTLKYKELISEEVEPESTKSVEEEGESNNISNIFEI